MKQLWIYPCVICLLLACTRELPFDRGQFQPELVVNGLLSPDSVMAVYVHQTVPLDTGAWRAVSGAEVLIYEAGQPEPVRLTHRGGGRYEADRVYPSIGGIYELRVNAGPLGQARAVDTVPPKPMVQGVEYKLLPTFDQDGLSHSEIKFDLFNPIDGRTYFDLWVIRRTGVSNSFTLATNMDLPDPVVQHAGCLDYRPTTFVFSNHLMTEEWYPFEARMGGRNYLYLNGLSILPEEIRNKSAILLRRTSAAYYQHQKAWVRHHYQQPIGSRLDDYVQLLFGGEPTPLYSNVEGAHGVFAAFSTVVAEMKLIR